MSEQERSTDVVYIIDVVDSEGEEDREEYDDPGDKTATKTT